MAKNIEIMEVSNGFIVIVKEDTVQSIYGEPKTIIANTTDELLEAVRLNVSITND